MSFLFPPRHKGAAAVALRESGPVNIDSDDDLYRSNQGAIRDLIGGALRRAQEISVHMYRANPLANRAIKIYTTFMAGTGFAIDCDNPEVQQVADEYWTAERNRLDRNHRNFARSHLLFGETILPVAVDEIGNTTIGMIDPAIISAIRRNPDNNLILDEVEITGFGSSERKLLQIVRAQADPMAANAGLMYGETFCFLHDRIGAASRGMPFLLPIIDWLDAYDQVLWELLERLKALRAFFWDVSVEGGDTEVENVQTQWGNNPPKAGSIRYHSKGVEVKAEAPQLGAYEDVAAARYILRHIATGLGVAPHWLGDPEDANRATADSMDRPVLRGLEDIQAEWRVIMEDVVRFAVDQKVAAGLLPRLVERHDEEGSPTGDKVPARDTVEVVVPTISDDDVEAAAGALATTANAFLALHSIQAIDTDTIRKVIRTMLPALGVPADELPDPEEDSDAMIASALQSLEAQGRRTRAWERLTQELSEP